MRRCSPFHAARAALLARALVPGALAACLLGACGEAEPLRAPTPHETLVKALDAPVVRVLDRATRAPEPWALVRVLDLGDGWPVGVAEPEHGDPELLLERYGTPLAANAKGLRSIPPPRGSTLVGVRDGARFGSLWLAPGAQGTTPLALEPAARRTLRARVLGNTGPPLAGVRVCLVDRTRRRGSRFPAQVRLRAVATSAGAEGIAELRWTETVEREWEIESSSLVLGVPLHEPVEVPVDPAQLPETPIDVRLPLTGSLTVNVFGLDGAPAGSGFRVGIAPLAQELGSSIAWMEYEAPLVGGRAVFPQVALDLELLVSVRPSELSGTQHVLERHVHSPSRAAQDLIEVLRFADEVPVLTGRVTTNNEGPLREEFVRVRVDEPDGSLLGGVIEVPTDRNGRFYFGLDAESPRRAGRLFRLQRRNEDGQLRRGISVDLSYTSLTRGVLDLGDLSLAGVPCRISGRIIDEQGAPASGVELALGSLSGESFEPATLLVTRSAESGDFAIFDWTGADAAWIQVHHPSFLPVAPMPVVSGERGRNITVFRGGAVEGAVDLPPGLGHQLLEVGLSKRRGGLPPGVLADEPRAPLFWDGSFRVSNVAPGDYDVDLLSLGSKLLSFGTVAVELGKPSVLDTSEWSDALQQLRRVEFSVLGADGAAAETAMVDLRRAGRAELEAVGAFPGGAVRFVTSSGELELFIRCAGGVARFDVDSLAPTLTVPAPLPVQLRWRTRPAPAGQRIIARIEYDKSDIPPHIVAPQRVEVIDTEAQFTCPLPGPYRITLPGLDAPPQTIDVLPNTPDQTFRLD